MMTAEFMNRLAELTPVAREAGFNADAYLVGWLAPELTADQRERAMEALEMALAATLPTVGS